MSINSESHQRSAGAYSSEGEIEVGKVGLSRFPHSDEGKKHRQSFWNAVSRQISSFRYISGGDEPDERDQSWQNKANLTWLGTWLICCGVTIHQVSVPKIISEFSFGTEMSGKF